MNSFVNSEELSGRSANFALWSPGQAGDQAGDHAGDQAGGQAGGEDGGISDQDDLSALGGPHPPKKKRKKGVNPTTGDAPPIPPLAEHPAYDSIQVVLSKAPWSATLKQKDAYLMHYFPPGGGQDPNMVPTHDDWYLGMITKVPVPWS